ncbi:MAG: hypothetical protein DMG49_27895 [Acidobacteria bacterium]|nr:MAG: hypothetical protein DMG49_27895 [Acidobacteriota bacterium]
MPRRALAAMLVFLLVGIPLPGRPAGSPNLLPLGVVTQASGAHFNAAKLSAGATIYDGDGLSTEAEGALQFRGSAAQLYLPGSSGVTFHGLPMGTQARLQIGTVVFSTAKAAAMEVLADEAFIRPLADAPTVAQVTVVGPKELQIRVRRGALQFAYAGETEKIAEGASYRIVLDPVAAAPSPFPQRGPVKAGRENKKFKIIIIVSIAWATEWALHEVFESPDRP